MRKYCCFNRWLAEWVVEVYALLAAIWEIVTLRLTTASDSFMEKAYRITSKQRRKCNNTCHPKPKLTLIVNTNKTKLPTA